jgi:MFS family permease
MVAVIIFTVGSAVCSIAKDFTTLLAGRCIQGAGGGGITTLTYVIVTDMVSLRERGKWFGMISLQWCIGAVVGPVLGGLFAESNWRWIFWLNLPFCGIGLIGIPVCLRLKHRTGKVMERMKEFDWFGSVLFVAGLTCFLVPMTWGKFKIILLFIAQTLRQ